MANPFAKITPDPMWLNADGIPDGISARRPLSVGRAGAVGVVRRSDYAVSFNAGMGITVTGGEAMVKGGDVTNQGMYYCYSDAAKNITVNAPPATAGTARIDQVVLRVFDGAHDGSGLSEGRIEIIEGVPQATADLNQNRDAAAANLTTLSSPPSKSLIILADILVANGVSALSSGVIRDRRRYCTEGGVSNIVAGSDTFAELAVPRPHSSLYMRAGAVVNSDYAGGQSAALVFLDRPISANKLIFTYRTPDATPGPSTTYLAAVCDASGRVIFNANSQTLGSAANTRFHDSMTMPLTFFDAGYYIYVFGLATATANGGNAFYYYGAMANVQAASGNLGAIPSAPNVFWSSSSGGAVFPTTRTILGYADGYASGPATPPVPMFALAR